MKLLPHSTPRAQRGAATLIVVMVLFFVISLVAAYTSRNLIFEQRTSNNQLRSTQALEVAEAGVEWALSMLNQSRIDGTDCQPSANTADQSFRQRFLNINSAGYILPRLTAGGAEQYAVCVHNGTDWTCSCTGSGTVTAPSTTQQWPAFKVRFLMTFNDASGATLPTQPAVVRVQAVGCTRLDAGGAGDCLSFSGPGAFNEGRAFVFSNLALTGGPSSAPQVALIARGNVNVPFAAYNTMAAGSGVTVQSGGTVTGYTTLANAPGSPGGPSTMVVNDSALSGLVPITGTPSYSTQDRMFSALFNLRPDAFRAQQAAIEPCAGVSPCSIAAVRTAATLNPWRPIWVEGELVIDSAGDVGSVTEPVLLVVNGNVRPTTSGVNINGMLYTRAANWDPGTATAFRVTGAAVAEGTLVGTGDLTFVHDTDVMSRLRWNSGTFVRIPGSWKDYQE